MASINKRTFCALALIAGIAICLQSRCSQAASLSQIDQLKAQFLPAEYRNRNFTVDELKKVFHDKCRKVTGVDNSTLYQDIEHSATTLMGCLSSLANVTAIQEEIVAARPIGDLDTVFHKYCTKVPAAKQCLLTFNAKVQPCLSEAERLQNAIMVRVATNLMGFMCAKGGDQIALFVAEEGPECFEANREAIGHCMNSSFAEYIPKDGKIDLYDLPELVLAPQHCIDLERFEACTLHHLEQCQEITPANVAESVFKFIKNETSCQVWIDAKANERSVLKDSRNAATLPAAATLWTTAIAILALLKPYFY